MPDVFPESFLAGDGVALNNDLVFVGEFYLVFFFFSVLPSAVTAGPPC
jgi:hypothetical protein